MRANGMKHAIIRFAIDERTGWLLYVYLGTEVETDAEMEILRLGRKHHWADLRLQGPGCLASHC